MPRTSSMLRWSLVPVTVGLLAAAQGVQAAEASLVSGLYKNESDQFADKDYGKKQTIEVGARYSDALDQRTYWFVTGLLQLKSYDKGDLPSAPADSTGLQVGGGLRYYFNKFGDAFSPYAEGQVAFRDSKDSVAAVGGYNTTEENGLYYGGSFGIRFNLARDFFVDLQTALFDSALFATEKVDHVTFNGGVKSTSTDQKKRTELYASSANPNAFGSVLVSMGMRF